MKDSGKMARQTEKDSLPMLTARATKETGFKITTMVKAWRTGLMVRNSKVPTSTV